MPPQPRLLRLGYSNGIITLYRVDGVNVAQEMERNEAAAKYVNWPSCVWLLLSFFLFPVRTSIHVQGWAKKMALSWENLR